MDRKHVLIYALSTVLITFVLALFWEFVFESGNVIDVELTHLNESNGSRWLHVLVFVLFATLPASALAFFGFRLIHELKARDHSMQAAEEQRLSFAADAAHELRTPLAVLRAHIDSLDKNDTTNQLLADVDLAPIGVALRKSLLSPRMLPLVRKLLHNTKRDGKPLREDIHFNDAYQANFGEVFKALVKIIGINHFLGVSGIF